MTDIKNLKTELAVLQRQIDDLTKKIEAQESAKGVGLWKPEIGEECWSIGVDGFVFRTVNYDTEDDHLILAVGNYFKTEEAAERHVKKLRVLQRLRELSGGYFPERRKGGFFDTAWVLYHNDEAWCATEDAPYAGLLVYFETYEAAERAIEELGSDLDVFLEP